MQLGDSDGQKCLMEFLDLEGVSLVVLDGLESMKNVNQE